MTWRNEETVALLRELDAIINGDRYFLWLRTQTLRAIRAKLRPEPVREPSPPLRHYEPPQGGAARVEIPPDRGATDPVANIGLRTTDGDINQLCEKYSPQARAGVVARA